MRISGAAFVRNGVQLGYPFIESIKSILPVCDEVVVAVGNSADGTREMIAGLRETKIKIIDTVWDDSKRAGGAVLSEQTNIAMSKCKGDWIFYIQADELIHEEDNGRITSALEKYGARGGVEGLAFDYLHFYGGYFTVQTGRHWYKREVRLVRNNAGIISYGDAQGFRKNGRKLKAAMTGARIFHYGWARPPEVMMNKIKSFHKLWHDDEWINRNCSSGDVASYFGDLGNIARFEGTHPALMRNAVNMESDAFIDACRREYLKKRTLGDRARDMARSLPMGGHRNFKLVRG
jgi:glycosyltransferase involved in cell wall biosynthesis